MLQLKYAAPSIQVMRPEDFISVAKVLLLKIHVITGWVIPDNELMNVLVDQFQKKLQETYFNLNPDEIEYAFRQHGTIIEDWGKQMNLNLIDKVLLPYLNQRLYLSADEEKKVPPPEQKIYSDDEIDNQHREDVEAFFQRLRKGMVPERIPHYYKSIMVKDKLMDEQESLSTFFTRMLESESTNIYIKE
jgi:hypothetical protein